LKLHVEDLLGNYQKLIMDPVHGGIPILAHEVAIIDHPLFQRLRFICQNDILSLVFPGATHSRFLHSIGAMHVGGRMFMALVENCLKILNNQGIQGIDSDTLEAISYFNRL
jgi:HD superfamily phosphohydrolase